MENGVDYEPLATITAEDIAEWGVEGEPQEGRVPLQELISNGGYHVERHEGDNFGYIAFEAFAKDPEANPSANSESGKMEIYSRAWAKMVNDIGRSEIQPIPNLHPSGRGLRRHVQRLGQQGQGRIRLPAHHPRTTCGAPHTVFDNIGQLREAFSSNVYISSVDARALGISDGDAVLLSNNNGRPRVLSRSLAA